MYLPGSARLLAQPTPRDKSVGGRLAMSSCPGKDDGVLSFEKGVPLARVQGRIDHFPADLNMLDEK